MGIHHSTQEHDGSQECRACDLYSLIRMRKRYDDVFDRERRRLSALRIAVVGIMDRISSDQFRSQELDGPTARFIEAREEHVLVENELRRAFAELCRRYTRFVEKWGPLSQVEEALGLDPQIIRRHWPGLFHDSQDPEVVGTQTSLEEPRTQPPNYDSLEFEEDETSSDFVNPFNASEPESEPESDPLPNLSNPGSAVVGPPRGLLGLLNRSSSHRTALSPSILQGLFATGTSAPSEASSESPAAGRPGEVPRSQDGSSSSRIPPSPSTLPRPFATPSRLPLPSDFRAQASSGESSGPNGGVHMPNTLPNPTVDDHESDEEGSQFIASNPPSSQFEGGLGEFPPHRPWN
ncbi:MAG: hypothetical protein M1823_000786 [Watsoniomyces obsoletus]|nr:MAG: hypothetical protein M1823_000786 [Watsoniomyces obsoletus]